MSDNTEVSMNTYRISGWYRDEPDEIRHIDFEAVDDTAAWSYELPPRFMSLELGRFEGERWKKLELSKKDLEQSVGELLSGILSQAK